MKFCDLMESISEMSTTAQAAAEEQAADRLEDLFDIDEDGVLEPVYVPIRLNGDIIQVPKMALRNLSSMKMESISVELETEIDISDDEMDASLKNGLRDSATIIKIQAQFAPTDAPEAISLLHENFCSKVAKQLSILKGVNNNG